MKNAIWVVLASIVIAAAYFVFVKPNMESEPVPVAETPAASVQAPTTVEDGTEDTNETAQEAV